MLCVRRLCLLTLTRNNNVKWNKEFQRTLSSSASVFNIIRSEFKDIEIPKITLSEFVYPEIVKNSKQTATECPSTGRKYTYGDIFRKSKNFGKSLRKIFKLKKGDVVAVLLPNTPEYPIVSLGSLDAGLVVTTINPIYTPREILYQLEDSDAKALITLCELHETAKAAKNSSSKKNNIPIITIKDKSSDQTPENCIDFEQLSENKIDLPDVSVNAEDLAFLPYSSGTTGLAKGVELTHYNLVANLTQSFAPELDLYKKSESDGQEIIPAVLPMFHIYGLNALVLAPLFTGSKILPIKKFTPEDYIKILRENKCHVLILAPPLVLFLTLHPDVKKEYFENVRLIVSGAAPLGALDEERFIEKLSKNLSIRQGYGLTECSPVVTSSPPNNSTKGSVGVAIPNTTLKVVAIDDPSGTPLGPNKSGELLVKGPQVMKKYHNRQKETDDTFLDGWFKTGDIVHYNENKEIFVTDRLKELIKVKGFQVPPAELEEIIRNFPDIADAGVVGIPDEFSGEVPRAFVVPKKGKTLDVEKLHEYVNSRVAKHKRLAGGIEIMESIPKNASGKILRRHLKENYLSKNN